jgi:hypothetical protein
MLKVGLAISLENSRQQNLLLPDGYTQMNSDSAYLMGIFRYKHTYGYAMQM